jgi:uncharacterized protein YgiM (DUF1202 family)
VKANKTFLSSAVAIVLLILMACAIRPTPTPEPVPTVEHPTATPTDDAPTQTPAPTMTPRPTEPPNPTQQPTPEPTPTPAALPTSAATPQPTTTPTPSPTPDADDRRQVVGFDNSRFRTGPGLDYSAYGHLHSGEEVEVVSEAEAWCRIINPRSEWVHRLDTFIFCQLLR